jgi:hypothetical protein
MKKADTVSRRADRLPYSKPVLKIYGRVAEITNSADMIGAKDGSTGGNNRT